jgi:hypothetical protein
MWKNQETPNSSVPNCIKNRVVPVDADIAPSLDEYRVRHGLVAMDPPISSWQQHFRRPRRLLLVIITLSSRGGLSSAYRVGDAVDTGVRYGSVDVLGVLRRQRPLFGKDSTAVFDLHPDLEEYFTMTFEDGLWGLPTVPLSAKSASSGSSSTTLLSSWTVYFVYSKSTGNGEIHKVTHSTPEYKPMSDKVKESTFSVHYKWIEEPEVDVEAGRTMLMAIVLIASVIIIVSTLFDEEPPNGFNDAANGSLRSIPKLE